MNKLKTKTKDLESPWITKGIKKSSKRKQHLYLKFKKKKKKSNKKKQQEKKIPRNFHLRRNSQINCIFLN